MGRLNRNRRMKNFGDDAKPMDGIANLSDAMLVFACGLMIAIAVNWKVDLKVQKVDIEPEQTITESEISDAVNNSSSDGNVYEEMGKVYMDNETGEMYMITD